MALSHNSKRAIERQRPHFYHIIDKMKKVLYANPCNMQTEIGSRNGKHQAVCPIKQPAVAGNQIAEVLNSKHSFDHGFSKISDLPKRRSNQCRDHTDRKGHMGEKAKEPDQNSGDDRGQSTADAAFY